MSPVDPSMREPIGDHNRRIDLGLDIEQMAAEAGVTVEQLRDYETGISGHPFDLEVAARVGVALERLEANPPPSQQIKT
jgi:transcriptional regulator with XRE-family HTH domain